MPSVVVSDRVVLGGAEGPLRVEPAVVRLDQAGRIASVDPVGQMRPSGDDVLDVGAKLVTPAFINGHTHLSLTCLRGVGGVRANAQMATSDL